MKYFEKRITSLTIAQSWHKRTTQGEMPFTLKRYTCFKCGKWNAVLFDNEGQILTKTEGK